MTIDMPTRRLRRSLLALAATALSLAFGAAPAHADTWPSKPVRLVVPFPAGAAPDVVARLVADRLARSWGQSVYIENKPGAGGIPGMSTLARAPADGYTIGFVPAAAATLTPLLYKNPQFNIDSDIVPVANIGISPMMVAVNSSSNIYTVADLVREAKAQPGKLNFAAAQANSVPHLTGEMLSRAGELQLFTVPYSGSPTATNALLAGDAKLTVDGLPALVQHVKGGKLRAIAVTSAQRLPGFENVPTVGETFKGFESVGWFALFVPAGTPVAVVDQINRETNKLLQQPDLVAQLADLGVYPRPGPPAAMGQFLAEQRALARNTVRDLGLQAQ
ncbi:Bug family tripartite tricarboxylate transporter substrate binding protein [Variovorax sp. HJSM1_2]|uniref:Bug family tripartite tricarboxylate transporter substrate binding protein n=1 Tax=Variovorax sp. HJSM1_2 TaxID=3366263 RepID=UPI003BECBF7D